MRSRVPMPVFPFFIRCLRFCNNLFSNKLHSSSLATARAFSSSNGGSRSNSSHGSSFVGPWFTAATILMLGALHVRRLYEENKHGRGPGFHYPRMGNDSG